MIDNLDDAVAHLVPQVFDVLLGPERVGRPEHVRLDQEETDNVFEEGREGREGEGGSEGGGRRGQEEAGLGLVGGSKIQSESGEPGLMDVDHPRKTQKVPPQERERERVRERERPAHPSICLIAQLKFLARVERVVDVYAGIQRFELDLDRFVVEDVV